MAGNAGSLRTARSAVAVAVIAAAVGLAGSTPAAAETPVRQQKVQRTHLVVIPVIDKDFSARTDLTAAYARRVGKTAADFWTKNTNGAVPVSVAVTRPIVTSVPGPGCDPQAYVRAMMGRSGIGAPVAHTHYMALIGSDHGPCGIDDMEGGAARMFGQSGFVRSSLFLNAITYDSPTHALASRAATDGHVMAHELGHNFGFDHIAVERCVAAGVEVPTSSNCTVLNPYGDSVSIMGRGTGLTALERYLFGERMALGKVTKPRARPYLIHAAASKAYWRELVFRSRYGLLTAEYDPAFGVTIRNLDRRNHLQQVLTFGSETLPDRDPGAQRRLSLWPGDTYRIPGTRMSLTVGDIAATAAIRVWNAAAPEAPLPAPTGTTVTPTGEGWLIAWNPVPGTPAGYRVLANGVALCAARPTQGQVLIPDGLSPATSGGGDSEPLFTVVSVNATGVVGPPGPVASLDIPQAGEPVAAPSNPSTTCYPY